MNKITVSWNENWQQETPSFIITFPSHYFVKNEDIEGIIESIITIFRLQKPFLLLVDCFYVETVENVIWTVQRVVKFMNEYRQYFRSYVIASGIYMGNDFLISLFKMIFKLRKPTSPNLLSSNYQEIVLFFSQCIQNKSS